MLLLLYSATDITSAVCREVCFTIFFFFFFFKEKGECLAGVEWPRRARRGTFLREWKLNYLRVLWLYLRVYTSVAFGDEIFLRKSLGWHENVEKQR